MQTTPTILGIPVVDLALAVSLLSFALSIVSLAWQLLKQWLDGGRVRVRMNLVILLADGLVVTQTSGRYQPTRLLALADQSQRAEARIEVAEVVIENAGRTPLTVVEPTLRVWGAKHRRYTVTPTRLDRDDWQRDTSSDPSALRIEPYGLVRVHFDFWPALQELKDDKRRDQVTLRAEVRVAGKRLCARSSWRRRWTIQPGLGPVEADGLISPRNLIFGMFFRSSRMFLFDGKPTPMWFLRSVSTALVDAYEANPGDAMLDLEEKLRVIGASIPGGPDRLPPISLALARQLGEPTGIGPWPKPTGQYAAFAGLAKRAAARERGASAEADPVKGAEGSRPDSESRSSPGQATP